MKLVQAKAKIYDWYSEKYDLTDVLWQTAAGAGLKICYLFTQNEKIQVISLTAQAKPAEVGVPLQWEHQYNAAEFAAAFQTLDDFLRQYDDAGFGFWQLTALYETVELTVSGTRDQTAIGVSYPLTAKITVLPLLAEVEAASYAYHSFPPHIISLMKKRFHLSAKQAVLSIKKLSAYPDILQEFLGVLERDGRLPEDRPAIAEQGYSAGQLHAAYPLSILGAYQYLIYLREAPGEALDNLKKGLPRK